MASQNVLEITEQNWESIHSTTQPVLVDFWAPWCSPCRALNPTIEKIADQYAGKVTVGKVNTDENPLLAGKFDISAIPCLMVFKNGEVVDKVVGAVPASSLSRMLDGILNG